MKKRLKLVIPNEEYKNQVQEFVEEFRKNGEHKIPGSGELEKFPSFEEWLQKINDDLSKEAAEKRGRVQAIQYIAVRIEDNKIIGVVQLRYRLNEHLYYFGGHIGDAIRPSERNKGYSTEMIGLALEEAKKFRTSMIEAACEQSSIC